MDQNSSVLFFCDTGLNSCENIKTVQSYIIVFLALPSNRPYLSSGACLEDKTKIIRAALCCCVWQLCTMIHTREQFLHFRMLVRLKFLFVFI